MKGVLSLIPIFFCRTGVLLGEMVVGGHQRSPGLSCLCTLPTAFWTPVPAWLLSTHPNPTSRLPNSPRQGGIEGSVWRISTGRLEMDQGRRRSLTPLTLPSPVWENPPPFFWLEVAGGEAAARTSPNSASGEPWRKGHGQGPWASVLLVDPGRGETPSLSLFPHLKNKKGVQMK